MRVRLTFMDKSEIVYTNVVRYEQVPEFEVGDILEALITITPEMLLASASAFLHDTVYRGQLVRVDSNSFSATSNFNIRVKIADNVFWHVKSEWFRKVN